MLKKIIIALGMAVFCTALLTSKALASENVSDKVDISSSKETLAIMESQLGNTTMRSLGVPSYDQIEKARLMWYTTAANFSRQLSNGSTAHGLMLCIDLTESNYTQNNVVRFNLPSQYAPYNFEGIFDRSGSYDNLEINGNMVTVYNPRWNGDNTVVYDVCIGVPFENAFTNNTGSVLEMTINGLFNNYSSGTELVDTLTQYINVPSIVHYVALVMSAIIGIVFMWWGVRKLISAFMGALRTGRAGA